LDGGRLRLAALENVVDEVAVATQAARLQNGGVPRLDHDWLVEILERETFRVVITVGRLGLVFCDRRMGKMAIDALGAAVMRALRPRRVLVVHDVAVGAGPRIGGEIAAALSIVEREGTDAACRPECRGERECGPAEAEHANGPFPFPSFPPRSP